MNIFLKKSIFISVVGLFTITANAQVSTNPDKFLGNITTGYNNGMDTNGLIYHNLWNQVTPENASKWGSVEGTRGSFNWGCDTPFNYAKQWKFTYKFHAFVWGAQYPNWFSGLSIKDRYAAIVTWFDAIKKKYSTLPLIDVVNEAVGTHQPGNPMMKESLGGGGKTGYDWLIKAFELAYERFPNSILIYNDYNSLRWDVDNYITLVQTLRDAGAPIDAYGNQAHDVGDISEGELSSVLQKQQNALKMPMYITELDISKENDSQQKAQYQKVLPLMWEAPYCAGVTIWGWIYGSTWDQAPYSGLYKNGTERSAMTWIRDYMKSDAAKNAKSPYPGMKKRVSVFVKPLALKVAKGDVLPIKVRTFITDDAKKEKADIAIDKVDLYVDNVLLTTMTEEPYVTEYTSESSGKKTLKAIVYTNDGNTYERYSNIEILNSTEKREPYNGTATILPGIINVGEYDKGASGVSYSSNASRNTTTATKDGAWMEYTVDVKEAGLYSFDAEVASTVSGGTFHLSEYSLDNLTFFADMIEVPKTGSNTNFQTMHTVFKKELTAGRHVLCLNIDKGGFYIKNLTFHKDEKSDDIKVTFPQDTPKKVMEGEKTTITVNASSETSTIANVMVYVNNLLVTTLTQAPFTFEYEPTAKGTNTIMVVATDTEGKSKTSTYTLTVSEKRGPFAATGPTAIPGTLQAEFFDKGGEGVAYHDNDAANQGDGGARSTDGVDVVKGNNGRAVGYTNSGEWMEYTVNVKEAGTYSYKATVSSGTTNSGFSINLNNNGKITKLADVKVPQTGSNDWGTYKVVEGTLSKDLEAGEQILRITITGSNCNIDKIQFILEASGISEVVADTESMNGAAYNLSGQQVNGNYKGIIIQNGKKRLSK